MRLLNPPLHTAFVLIVTIGLIEARITRAADASQPHVFYAGASEQFPDEFEPSLLPRELARQAVLMAARDGLGLDTRDEVLGEWNPSNPVPPDSAAPPLRLDIHSHYPKSINLDVVSIGKAATLIQQIEIPTDYSQMQWLDLARFVETTEQLAEGDDLKMLQTAGYTGKPVASSDGDLPSQIDDLLYKTSLMAPLSALQRTHALIRQSGESQARLGALVRGYANLGQLTRFQWSSINKVMTARSLLYAQKMVVHDPNSAIALYHRAYAFALAGLHKAALDDLTAAAKLSANTPQPLPAWAELIEPLCDYDVSKLQSLVDNDARRAPLAALCCFLDVENCGSYSRLTNIGQTMLQHNPACFRIIDGLTANAGIATGHGLTEAPFQIMLDTLRSDIQLLPVMPVTVQDAFKAAAHSGDHVSNLANVSAAFTSATEDAEPSYPFAGQIIQETNFLHVERRAYFMADQWGVETGDFIEQMLPLIQHHRYKPFIKSLAHPLATRAQLLADLQIIDPQFQMMPMFQAVNTLGRVHGQMNGRTAYLRSYTNNDGSAYDLERTFYPFRQLESGSYELDQAKHCLLYSPHSGTAVSVLVKNDWKNSKPQAAKWVEEFGDQPAVLFQIGNAYSNDNELDKAESVLLRCVEIAPDRMIFEKLASVYLALGKEDKWESTLLQVKDHPDLGLDHASVDNQIAEHYMNAGKYEKARPFADAASDESGAGWAMQTAALADEYCGDYTAAEKQIQSLTERYGDPEWFLWCKRTGKGNLIAATAAADAWIAHQLTEKNIAQYDEVGLVYYLENKPAEAREYLEQAMNDRHEAWAGMLASCVCLQQKDLKGRNADLQFVADQCKRDSDGTDDSAEVELAKLELACGDKSPTKEQLDKGLVGQDLENATNLFYFAGRVRELTGETTKAQHDYQSMLKWAVPSKWCFILACDQLHQMGITDTPLPRAHAN